MGTTADKLNKILDSKEAIREAINDKGVVVGSDVVLADYADKILEISGGGPTPTEGDITVKFLYQDENGVAIKEVKVNKGDSITAYPDIPTVNKLGHTGWTHSLSELSNIQSDINVGAEYNTTDGGTYVFVSLTPTIGLTLILRLSVVTNTSIDWGDGNVTTASTANTHTYDNYGDYVIRIAGTQYTLGGGTSTTTLVGGSNETQRYALKKVYVGFNTLINNSAFYYNRSLENIVIPNTITTIGSSVFSNNYALKNLVIPKSVTSIGGQSLQYCYSLANIVLPNTITEFPNQLFQYSYTLENIVIPNTITATGNGTFFTMTNLKKVDFPELLTTIGTQVFFNAENIKTYIFRNPTPPTLANVNVFNGINLLAKIYVPDASVSAYKAATNWLTLANYIYPISELN